MIVSNALSHNYERGKKLKLPREACGLSKKYVVEHRRALARRIFQATG